MFDEAFSSVFEALGNETRRRILDVVKASPGCTVQHIADHFEMSKVGVLKHVRVLEESGLLITEKVGRERHCDVNTAPIQMIYDRWTTEFSSLWAQHITRIKYSIESFRNKGERDGQAGPGRVSGRDRRGDRRRMA